MTFGLAVTQREALTYPMLPSKAVTELGVKPLRPASDEPAGSVPEAPAVPSKLPSQHGWRSKPPCTATTGSWCCKYSVVHPADDTDTDFCRLLL